MKNIYCLLLFLIISLSVAAQNLITNNTPLSYVEHKPTRINKNTKLIILLHGYGSNELDLFSLYAQLPSNAIVLSARAPYSIGKDSYAWYDISFDNGVKTTNQLQSDSSTNLISQFIKSSQIKYKIKSSSTYIGGFSQGGIMSYNIGLTQANIVKGIFVLSGRLQEATQQKIIAADKLRALKIFIAHGSEDQVIAIAEAVAAKQFLNNNYIAHSYFQYKIGHSICTEEMSDLKNWMEKE